MFVLFKQFYDFIRQREIVKKTYTDISFTPAVGKAGMGLYAEYIHSCLIVYVTAKFDFLVKKKNQWNGSIEHDEALIKLVHVTY